jgi:hypothetical protein
MQTSDPFAVPPRPAHDPFAIPPTPSPFAPPTTGISSSSAVPLGPSFAPSIPVEPPKRSGVPLWFWAIIALFVPFGGVAAYAIFFRSQPPPQQIVVQVPATPTAPTASSAASNDVPPPDTSAAPTTSSTGGRIATGPRQKPRPGDPPSSGGGGIDLSGLGGSPGGPAVGGGAGGGGPAGGGLDQTAVQQVVRNRSAGVKRTCWERGGNDQKSSANVQVTVTVAPNGQVANASATGDDPVIAKCIEGQVRTWSFPAPGQTTTINIPFHFVRQ